MTTNGPDLRDLLAEREIERVLLRYCRGIDRRDFALVARCYHPDATDDHGEYRGSAAGFIEHAKAGLPRFESTMHFLGNRLIDVAGAEARSESYVVAFHRLAATDTKPARDLVIGLRYVDRFEQRDGSWKIAHRVCAYEWSRLDPVPESPYRFTEQFVRGRPDAADVVYQPRGAVVSDHA